MKDNLTISELLAIQHIISEPLYYVTDENMKEDELLVSKETLRTPEFVVFHPNRIEEMKANAKAVNRRLVHLRYRVVH